MSIEKDLSRIAVSLEAIAAALQDRNAGVSDEVAPPATVEQPPVQQPPVQQPPVQQPPAQQPPVQQPAAAAAAQELITMEALNEACGKAAEKLGDGGPIFAILQEFGAQSIPQLKPESYSDVMARVRAL